MSLNKWMHPKNPYKTPPNFKEMAMKYPEFRKVVTQDISGKIHLDFNDPLALRILTTTLFKKDFQLDVLIPDQSLVPTLPSRLNYLLWVGDLLDLLQDLPEDIIGVDIGTGASAVYPLLAAKHLGWKMTATERDHNNYEAAVGNVSRNELDDKIQIKLVSSNEIFNSILSEERNYNFTMCNPPFFKPDKDFESDLPGTVTEMLTEGGEVEFVNRMVEESIKFGLKVDIFTVLLGHKSSVSQVKRILSATKHVTSLTTTQFCQGRTMRWGVAWTFQSKLALDTVIGTKAKKEKPKPYSFTIEKSEKLAAVEHNALKYFRMIRGWLEEIKVEVLIRKENKYFSSARLTAREKGWQHQRKKRREKARGNKGSLDTKCSDDSKVESGKFSELVTDSEETSREEVEDALMSELISSEAGCKAGKNDAITGDDVIDTSEALLECDLFVKWAGPVVRVDLCYIKGQGGRESVHQLSQFLKNKYSISR